MGGWGWVDLSVSAHRHLVLNFNQNYIMGSQTFSYVWLYIQVSSHCRWVETVSASRVCDQIVHRQLVSLDVCIFHILVS